MSNPGESEANPALIREQKIQSIMQDYPNWGPVHLKREAERLQVRLQNDSDIEAGQRAFMELKIVALNRLLDKETQS